MGSLKISLILLSIFLLLPAFILGDTVWSNNPVTFNVTPSPLNINWTSSYEGNLTLSVNISYSAVLSVGNASHTVKANYSQPDGGWSYGSNYDQTLCGLNSNSFKFKIKNETGYYTETKNLTGESTVMTLERIEDCPPGRYYGLINVTNSSNPSHYATAAVLMDIPVSSFNSLDTTVGIGQFRGTVSTADKTYHSYFFNTSEIGNATSLTVTLDLDVFLFDSIGFKAKNILGTSDKLVYKYLPQNEIWEIRLFDNSSSSTYSGLLKFSTLNATNASDASQQLSSINFGSMNPSENKTVQIRLENEGALNLSSVAQSSELYNVQVFQDSTPKNFTFRVPDFTTKIRVGLNWTGSANYTLKLYKPSGSLVSTSSEKYKNANVSGVMQEEYVEYTGTVGTSDDGLWKIEILNNTAAAGSFTLTVKEWNDATNWMVTNYTTRNFNTDNRTADVEMNFTVQNATLSGIYEGSLIYTSSLGAILKIPFTVNVTAPELFVNNTFISSTISFNENIGSNRNLALNITVNNTGNEALSLSNSNSSGWLQDPSNTSNYISFSYSAPSSVGANSSSLLNITITIDTIKTANMQGTYSGWIYLNDSNAHPYEGFNLTLQVNLNDDLNVYLVNISTKDGDATITDASTTENVTLKTKVYYTNGTAIENDLGLSNFGSVYLSNKNVSYTITGLDSTLANASATLWQDGPKEYQLNFTLTGSSTRPGGYYDVYLSANKSVSGGVLGGSAYNGTLAIPGSGLYFTETWGLDDFGDAGEVQYYQIKVLNYGTQEASTQMNLTLTGGDCDDYIEMDVQNVTSGCGSDGSGTKFILDIDPGETCYFTWEVKVPSSVDTTYVIDEEDCTVDVKSNERRFNELPDDSFDIYIDTSEEGGTGGEEEEVSSIEITEYPSLLSITQGKSKNFTIMVENTGDTAQSNIVFSITGISSDWYSYTPSNLDLVSGYENDFTVSINVPSDAEVKNYSLTFKASNSVVSNSKSSVLNVLPSEEEKEKINQTYGSYLGNYTYLVNKMNEFINEGRNVTELNETLNQVKSKLDLLSSFIENDDYFNAAQVLDEIESLLTTATSQLTQEETVEEEVAKEEGIYVWPFVGVIVIIIIGFIIYLFMPSPKEAFKVRKFKYVPPETKEPVSKRIKKSFTKIKTKISLKKKNKKEGYTWKKN